MLSGPDVSNYNLYTLIGQALLNSDHYTSKPAHLSYVTGNIKFLFHFDTPQHLCCHYNKNFVMHKFGIIVQKMFLFEQHPIPP